MSLSSKGIARCKTYRHQIDEVNGIPLNSVYFGDLHGLPQSKDMTYYIVSNIVAQAAKTLKRKDCLIPDDTVRNEKGQVVGCRGLAVV